MTGAAIHDGACVFCAILAGSLPASVVHEDAQVGACEGCFQAACCLLPATAAGWSEQSGRPTA